MVIAAGVTAMLWELKEVYMVVPMLAAARFVAPRVVVLMVETAQAVEQEVGSWVEARTKAAPAVLFLWVAMWKVLQKMKQVAATYLRCLGLATVRMAEKTLS